MARSVAEGALVELREVTAETVRAICRLELEPGQERFVASNAVSIAEAHFSPHAWFRAIYVDGVPVGFVMTEERPDVPSYYLWRFMIAAGNQRRGYGRRALQLLIDRIRTMPGARELLTSWVPGEGGPEDFYRRLGFEPTGEIDEGEIVARLVLDGSNGGGS